MHPYHNLPCSMMEQSTYIWKGFYSLGNLHCPQEWGTAIVWAAKRLMSGIYYGMATQTALFLTSYSMK